MEVPWLRRPPGCGGPWAAFSSGAVEAHPTLEYQNIKGDKTYVEAPGCGGPLGNCPTCPVLPPAQCFCVLWATLQQCDPVIYGRFCVVGYITTMRSSYLWEVLCCGLHYNNAIQLSMGGSVLWATLQQCDPVIYGRFCVVGYITTMRSSYLWEVLCCGLHYNNAIQLSMGGSVLWAILQQCDPVIYGRFCFVGYITTMRSSYLWEVLFCGLHYNNAIQLSMGGSIQWATMSTLLSPVRMAPV